MFGRSSRNAFKLECAANWPRACDRLQIRIKHVRSHTTSYSLPLDSSSMHRLPHKQEQRLKWPIKRLCTCASCAACRAQRMFWSEMLRTTLFTERSIKVVFTECYLGSRAEGRRRRSQPFDRLQSGPLASKRFKSVSNEPNNVWQTVRTFANKCPLSKRRLLVSATSRPKRILKNLTSVVRTMCCFSEPKTADIPSWKSEPAK